MHTKLILHDLNEEQMHLVLPNPSEDTTIFHATPEIKPCIGCFGCWVKTPGKCIIKDSAQDFATLIATHDEVIVISRLVFGGLSPDVKTVLDRSIGFILPFFRDVQGEMHHTIRYKKTPPLKYVFYSANMSESDKEVARKLVLANGLNFGTSHCEALFYDHAEEAKEVFA